MTPDDASSIDRYEDALAHSAEQRWTLRLYIAGATPTSQRAIANLIDFCDRHLADRHTLEVVDISQRPALAAADQIVAVPTLVRLRPAPPARVVGDLSDERQLLVGLDLEPIREVSADSADD